MKVLIYDIETLPNLITAFRCGKQFIGPHRIVKERSIISAAWSWLDECTVHDCHIAEKKRKFKKDPYDDEYVVRTLHGILAQADVMVGHNVDRFDWKFFNGRAIFHQLDPLPPILSVDTLKVAKKYFDFNSNRMGYIAEYLGISPKMDVDGELWDRIREGDEDAVHEMVTYNRQDVRVSKELYLRFRPYMKQHPNLNAFTDSNVRLCPACGSDDSSPRGFSHTMAGKYARFKCNPCGKWFQSGKNVLFHKPVAR